MSAMILINGDSASASDLLNCAPFTSLAPAPLLSADTTLISP